MPRIHFAVLAHENEPCVADLVRTLWDLNPGCSVSLFNGGRNRSFFRGQGVPICPGSRPLRYGNLTAFHIGVMRWLIETRESFDFLVTLDHDVMPLRAGLADYLATQMSELSYMGARLREADRPDEWVLGGSTVSQVNQSWKMRWQPLFGTDTPYWAFNPGQAFSRALVERILKHPQLDALMNIATRSRIWAIEEVVYPTLAVSVGAETIDYRGERGLVFGHHTPAEIRDLAADPEVHWVHRVGMRLDASDRRAIHAHIAGQTGEQLETEQGEPPRRGPTRLARTKAPLVRTYNRWHVKHRG